MNGENGLLDYTIKQTNLFNRPTEDGKKRYSQKIDAPIYEPKNIKPHVLELYDKSKTNRLIRKINAADLSSDEKIFLLEAAGRHTVFNYERIADYYAHATREIQELMESSALVIIDFDKAIQLGYVQLSEEIKRNYLQEYEKLPNIEDL